MIRVFDGALPNWLRVATDEERDELAAFSTDHRSAAVNCMAEAYRHGIIDGSCTVVRDICVLALVYAGTLLFRLHGNSSKSRGSC